ncbi:helix-turn-helix transcriptional regulator [Tabrizicola fusiformis]|uniref:helix-turn-helix transcriptional regulator n=1 Tax=Tabrizicola sp. SY72 TaxID=2741673 RepID=UPI0015722A7A|nr:helix-turn-helix transcriptional regulator [Tabrizicola sp. SY72]NTT85057.1 helix-turn-helix transcriptional regulator [Tabrizicola sp. SY72]
MPLSARLTPFLAPALLPGLLFGLILFQSVCATFFVIDVAADLEAVWPDVLGSGHLMPELGATLGLLLGIGCEALVLWRLLRRQARLQQGMSVAAGALAEVMEGFFAEWALTPAEADVARFTVKGYAIAEIAGFRGSAEATVKTHLNAIYRKAGVAGRAQLVSLLVEDLLRAPLVSVAAEGARAVPDRG